MSATLRTAGQPPELTYKSGGTCYDLAKGEGKTMTEHEWTQFWDRHDTY